MEKLKLREKEIFETLKRLAECEFVIIGGYAVNAYVLPRFSVDCDMVIKRKELGAIEKKLQTEGYAKMEAGNAELPYGGGFARYEKEIEKDFFVSFDVLVDAVYDRISGTVFSAGWVYQNARAHHRSQSGGLQGALAYIREHFDSCVPLVADQWNTQFQPSFATFPSASSNPCICS